MANMDLQPACNKKSRCGVQRVVGKFLENVVLRYQWWRHSQLEPFGIELVCDPFVQGRAVIVGGSKYHHA